MRMQSYKNIDEYLANYSGITRERLELIRQTVREIVPEAEEKISYGIPTFALRGNLIHFAGYDGHVGFYPGAAPIKEFAKELSEYKTSKGTVQFPLAKPLPLDLIRQITRVCVQRNLEKKK